jgi:hypothetical protein
MTESRDWAAVYTPEADGVERLRISGLCIFPTTGWGVELRRREAQDAEDELVLELMVEKPTGPVLQVVTGRRYAHVSILPDGPFGLAVADAGEAVGG